MDPNGFLLALDQYEPGEEPIFPEWFHFGMCRGDPEWARNLYQRMKTGGIKILGKLEDSKTAIVFFCCSPGGYKIEVREQVVNHVPAQTIASSSLLCFYLNFLFHGTILV